MRKGRPTVRHSREGGEGEEDGQREGRGQRLSKPGHSGCGTAVLTSALGGVGEVLLGHIVEHHREAVERAVGELLHPEAAIDLRAQARHQCVSGDGLHVSLSLARARSALSLSVCAAARQRQRKWKSSRGRGRGGGKRRGGGSGGEQEAALRSHGARARFEFDDVRRRCPRWR